MTVAGVTLLAAAAGSGKTGIAMGVARALADQGVPVQPFKAVAVVTPDDPAYDMVEPWKCGTLHNCGAARATMQPWHNPVSVLRPSRLERRGDLYLWGERQGEVPVPGDDLLDLTDLSPALRHACTDAVAAAVAQLRTAPGIIVAEGGGGAGEVAPHRDLANHVAPILLGNPILLVLNAGRSGHVAALLGQSLLMAPELKGLVIGYVANQIRDAAHWTMVSRQLAGRTPLRNLAVIDEVHQPSEYDGSVEQRERIYVRRAQQVVASGLLEALHAQWTALATISA
jgi:cobyrinic acid a,c-diamide synthase